MKLRWKTLWRVPVFCLVAGWICFYITVYLGRFFFVVRTPGADGVTEISIDPVRSAIFQGALFFAVLLLGGLWAFRSMTKGEIAVSSAILAAVYLVIVLLQMYWTNVPISLSLFLAEFQDWSNIVSLVFYRLTGSSELSAIITSFAPFLFVPFGKR